MKRIIKLFHHLFIPHSRNKYRAKVLHLDFLGVSLALVIGLSLLSDQFDLFNGDILGYATDITVQKVYDLTNEERKKAGLEPLEYNEKLSNAASKNVTFGSSEPLLQELDFIEIQKKSWENFITRDLKAVLENFFPIDDYTGKKFTLFFEDIYFGESQYTIDLCYRKKLTYDIPVYLKLRLLNNKTGIEKEQDVYFFNLPVMTERGTFIINGIERANKKNTPAVTNKR